MARVGVDIDGVLYPFDEELGKALIRNGKRLPGQCPPATSWKFFEEDGWNMTAECFIEYCDDFTNKHELFRHGDPYSGAAEQIDRLAKAGHEVILITNRNFGDEGVIQGSTQNWLFDNGFQYHELHFVKDKRDIDVDYHIDDNVDNCRAMAGAGVKVSLCNRAWNQDTAAFTIPAYRDSLETFVDRVLAVEGGEPAVEEPVNECCGGCIPPFPDATLTLPQGEVRVTSSTGGQKGSKLARFDLIPQEALWAVAELYGKGAEKYDDWNWRKGYSWSLSIAALMRHLSLFLQGQDYDEETGCHHLTAVIFHAMTLITFGKEHPEFDDRFKP